MKPKEKIIPYQKPAIGEERIAPPFTIDVEEGMIPLSVINYKGKPFKEARRFPKKIREGIICCLEVFHKEGFNSFEYTAGVLIMMKNNDRIPCYFVNKFLMKELFINLQEALELIGEYIEQRERKRAAVRARVATVK